MDVLDRTFHDLYDRFVGDGGLDQTTRIVDEDFERVTRQTSFCAHGVARRACDFCKRRLTGYREDGA